MSKKEIKALVENINGKMVAVASDDSQDRQGDAIPQDRWKLFNFLKNPVLLMSHQYHLPPVGIVKNIRIEGNKLIFEPVFHEITQAAREVKQMYLDGIMRAFSVGFMPTKDKSNELLEISAVSVPANANALMFSKSISDTEKKSIDEWVQKEANDNVMQKQLPEENAEKAILVEIKNINIRLDNIEKGRQSADLNSREILVRAIEKLNKSLGFLNRKLGK